MKLSKHILLLIGALLCAALVCVWNPSVNPLLADLGRHAPAFMLALVMAGLGVAMVPRSRNSRLVVKRELMTAASIVLFLGAGLLLANMFGVHGLLAALFSHPAGLAMAAGSIVVTEAELKEFKSVLTGLQEYRNMFSQLQDLGAGEGGFAAIKKLPNAVRSMADGYVSLQRELSALKKSGLQASLAGHLSPNSCVTSDCAEYLGAMLVCAGERQGKMGSMDTSKREALIERSIGCLGMQQRAALTTSDIVLPTIYSNQIVQLVWQYGQARKWGTVYPLGAGKVNLPRLKTDPAFGLIALSGPVTEKSPQYEYVEFDAAKWGGIIRIPSEIDADSLGALGNFLASYIGRNFAKIEDTVFWVADGTSTYNDLKGITKAALDLGNVVTLAGGKTKPSDITLSDMRMLRTKVSTAALSKSAYYLNKTMESILVTFNTLGTPLIYIPEGAGREATLDGYACRWVDVLPIFDTSAHASQGQVVFGDASYHYLGERGAPSIMTSLDVFFATDEIGMRALERFTTGLMADKALAALYTAAQ